jgi:NADH-quinone oxidoreductase subunit E
MSVRRLAEPAVQPAAFAFNKANAEAAKQWLKKYPKGREQSAVIPLLMIAQEQEGWVTKPAIEHIADMLDMPYIRALEVATFYTQFQLKPVGTRAHVQVCGTTPCMLRGSEALMEVCRSKIHPEQFHTNAGGTLSWEEVECLGACVNAPMVMVFKDTFEDLTPERLGEIIDAFEAGKGASVTPGPQNGRVYSAPISGLTTLKDESVILKATRDREAGAGAKEQAETTGARVPPSKAAKPKTYAAETNGSVRSPSPVKVNAKAEVAASVKAPAHDPVAADKAEPAVEAADKPRRRKSGDTGIAAAKSPELLRGEPIGPAGKRVKGDPAAPVGEPSPEAPRRKKPTGKKPV